MLFLKVCVEVLNSAGGGTRLLSDGRPPFMEQFAYTGIFMSYIPYFYSILFFLLPLSKQVAVNSPFLHPLIRSSQGGWEGGRGCRPAEGLRIGTMRAGMTRRSGCRVGRGCENGGGRREEGWKGGRHVKGH